ncbi:MAG: DUF2399 domain-containing protein [Lachnospiraceae bacterium]|nr:DUF2399 domain-containing protein [Lachnospiraceae bacterium]
MKKNNCKMTVGKWIVDKVNTKAWRAGKVTGYKHYGYGLKTSANGNDPIHDMMEAVGGRADFIRQVSELEQAGLITVTRKNVNTEIKEITVAIEDIDRLCTYEGVPNERKLIEEKKCYLLGQLQNTDCKWLMAYEQDLYCQLENGILEKNIEDENIFRLLNAITGLECDIWKRKFSSDVLHASKKFEKEYENKIITILRKYSPKADDSMTDDEVLLEHGIVTYSQTLQFKGSIMYDVGSGAIDTTTQIYGTVLNAQSLSHIKLISLKSTRRIITIENQANYEQMQFDSDVLYIYTHGFFSPKERRFLEQIEAMADASTEFFHWSDLDYGGIRIYQFIQQNIFKRVKPYMMDKTAYEKARKLGEGFELEKTKREKLEKLQCDELEELKSCILKYGREYEQEILLDR